MPKLTLTFDLTDNDLINLTGILNQDSTTTQTYLTTDEIMEKYKVSKAVLNYWKRGGLQYLRGRPNKFRLSDVEKFVKGKMLLK
jgi:hypothetical protein